MTKVISIVLLIMATVFVPQAFAGGPTNLVVVNGPGVPPEGIVLTGAWGWLSFLDTKKGPAPEPTLDLPRYVLVGYREDGRISYTVLYVWDPRVGRPLAYLPGPSEIGYRVNYGTDMSYKELAGKWYYFTKWDASKEWAVSIRKALSKINPDLK